MSVTQASPQTRPDPTDASAVAGAIETVESHLHPEPSYDLARHPQPSGREEIWRFTALKKFASLLAEGPALPGLDWSGEAPQGVRIETIDTAQARELAVEAPVDRLAAIAAARAEQATHLVVPADTAITEPVLLTANGRGTQAAEMMVIEIGAHASATIVMRFAGTAEYAMKCDVRVGDGANVNLVYINDWESEAVHGAQISLEVGRDAQVRTVHVSIGGRALRLVERAKYAGTGGALEQYGLYFVDAGQEIQHRTFVDHNQPQTSSNVDYRGALQGKGAHSVWVGDVLIRKVAENIETYESNKNLVLTDGCKADSVPNLEIQTGEIAGAGHASSTGRFDDEQLFYLRSRGLDEEEARRLVVQGFFNDIIRRIGVPSIEESLREIVEVELQALT